MIEQSKKPGLRLFAAVVLSLAAACSVSAGGQIPCADDSSCPSEYPVCSAGKCIAGTVSSSASIAIVAVAGHLPADMVRGTVGVSVTARASTGVSAVTLGGGSKTYQPAASSAPPLYAFDVPTTDFTDGDVALTATVTAGNGAATTSTAYTLHVDNTPPVITGPSAANPVLSQTVASSGTVLFIDLKVNEPATLDASAVTGTKTFPLGEVDSGASGVRRLQFAVGSTTPTGAYAVTIVATDRAGNKTTLSDSTSTPLHFNVTAPLNVTMSVTGHLDSSSNKIKINGIPAATTGDTVKAVVTLPAGVSFGAGFPHYKVIKPDATFVTFGPNGDGSGSFPVTPGEQQGVFTFHADVQDSAGSPATVEAPFLVQTTAPQVVSGTAGVVLGSNFIGPNKTGLTFDFSTDSTPATFTVTVNTHPATQTSNTGNHYFYSYTMLPSDLPGTPSAVARTISINVADVLGNNSTTTKTVTVDNLAPTMGSAPVSDVAVAGTAATVNLSFTIADTGAVGANPTVTVGPGGSGALPAALVSRTDHAGSSDFVYQYVVHASDAEGAASVAIDAKDVALNDFPSTTPAVFTIDRTAPALASTLVGTRSGSTPPTVAYQYFKATSTVWAEVNVTDCNLASVTASVGYVSTSTSQPVSAPMATQGSSGSPGCASAGTFVFSRVVAADEPNGPSTITFTGTDSAGNIGSITATYTVDNVLPTVSLTSAFLPTTSYDGNATLTLAPSEPLLTLTLKMRDVTLGHDYASGDTFGGITPLFTLDNSTPLPCSPCKFNLSGFRRAGNLDTWNFIVQAATDRAGNAVSGTPLVSTSTLTVDGVASAFSLQSMVTSPLYLKSTGTATVTFTGTATRGLSAVTMNPITLVAGNAPSSDATSCAFSGNNVTCVITASTNEGPRNPMTGVITDLTANTANYTATNAYTVDNTAPAIGSVALTGGTLVNSVRTYSGNANFNKVDISIPVTDCDTGTTVTVTAVDGGGNTRSFTAGTSAGGAPTTGTMGCASAESFRFFRTITADSEGVTRVQILVTDRAGNSSTTSVAYVVDTTQPTVLGTPFWSKTLGNNGGGGTLTFTVAVSEPIVVSINGTATVGNHTNDTIRLTDGSANTYFNAVTTNGITPTIALSSGTPSPCTLCVFTFSGLTKATSNIVFTPTLTLIDPVGNTTAITETGITYTNDTVPPDFSAGLTATPTVAGKNIRSGVVTVTGTASKPLQSVTFTTDDAAETTPAVCTLDAAKTKVTCVLTLQDTFNSSTLVVNVTVNPLDLAGNDKTNGATPSHYTTTYTLDNVTLTSGSAASPSTVAQNQVVTITGTANKTSLASATVAVTAGSGNGSCTVNTPGAGQWKCLVTATTSAATSTDTATITLQDTAGNQATPTRNYGIDNRAPTAGALTTPTTLPLVTGANSGVTLNFGAQGGGANCTTAGACFISTSNSAFTKNLTDNNSGSVATVTSGSCPTPNGTCLPNPTTTTTYTLTVTAVNGQVATSTLVVPVAPSITTFQTSEAIVTASGSNNITFNITVLGANCTLAGKCAITSPAPPQGDSTNVALDGQGSFNGGTNTYTFNTLQRIAPLGGMTYTLSVTDANSVTVTKSYTVLVVAAPSFSGTLSTPSMTGGAGLTQLTFTMPTMHDATSASMKDAGSVDVKKTNNTTYLSSEILAASGSTSFIIKAPTTSATGTTPTNFTYTLALSNNATTPNTQQMLATFTSYPLPTVGTDMAAGAGMPTVVLGGSTTAYGLTLPTFAQISATTGTLQLVDANASNAPIINNATGAPFTSTELLGAGTGGAVTARVSSLSTDRRVIGFQLIARNLASDAVNVLSNTVSLRVIPATAVNMNAVRFGATATVLPNGKVLIAGGAGSLTAGDCQGGTPVTTAEIYDPTTGNVTTPAHGMNVARCQHTAALIGTSVYMIGGANSTAADVFDTTAASGAGDFITASFPTALSVVRTRHTANVVSGSVFIIGGVTPGTTTALKSIEKFTPPNTLVTYSNASSQLSTARASHTATVFGTTNLLIFGGETADASAEIFDATCAASNTPNCISVGTDNNLTVRVFHSAVALSGGKILIAGGVDASSNPLSSAQIYDSAAGAGSKFSAAGSMTSSHVRFPILAFGTNKAAVFGGTGSAFDAVETFDLGGNAFTAYKVLASSRSAATASSVTNSFNPVPNKEVWVVAGGTVGTTGSIETLVGP